MKTGAFLCCLLCADAALADAVTRPCGGFEAEAQNLSEPWEDTTRTFANGAVRIAILDTLEPAAAFHLLVLSPPRDEAGGRQCRVISENQTGLGFAGLEIGEDVGASYSPETGLSMTLTVTRYDAETGDFGPAGLSLTVNQATGEIAAEIVEDR